MKVTNQKLNCNFGVTLKKNKTLLYQWFNKPNVTLKVESYT